MQLGSSAIETFLLCSLPKYPLSKHALVSIFTVCIGILTYWGLFLLVWGRRARASVSDCWARLQFHRLYGARSICRQILAGTPTGSLSAFSLHHEPVSHTRPCHT